MSLTLSALLVPYWAFVGVFAVFAIIDIWHMVRFGTYGIRNYLALFVFLAVTTIIFWYTAQLAMQIDWSLPIANLSNIGTMPGNLNF